MKKEKLFDEEIFILSEAGYRHAARVLGGAQGLAELWPSLNSSGALTRLVGHILSANRSFERGEK